MATIHNLAPVVALSDDPEVVAQADRLDATLWDSWIGAIRDGELRIPGRAPEEVPDMADSFDLIGFSYYCAFGSAGPGGPVPYLPDGRVGLMGYVPWAEGLGLVLRRLAEELPGRPLLVAEFGVGTDDDEWRQDVLRDGIAEIDAALRDGIDVCGRFHWTSVDNYEWTFGYDVPFGLFDHDRNPRASAALLRSAATG